MRIWGITGTNGKTTCTWIAATFIDGGPRRCGYVTTVEVDTRARRFSTGYTTPPRERLEAIFAEMEANGCTDCVMEVSSHAIHQGRTGRTRFAGGAFTNLSEDHLDYHRTMEAYFEVKRSFAEWIARGAADGPPPPYVVCLDGARGREMCEACRAVPGLRVVPVSAASCGFDFSRLPLAGAYNRSNVAVAAAIAAEAGVSRDEIQSKIPTLAPRWGRLEKVDNPFVAADVYVDFAHTPDGLANVLSAVRGFARGKVWVVFGAGGDRDPLKRPLMGRACARGADRLVVTSDNPRGEDPAAIARAVLGGVPEGVPVTVELDRAAAISHALASASAGDVVVVAGKGHETTQEIKGEKRPFDDREEIRRWRPR
jgi:UDP-N-acetylmuramoyl-L-alanyl-D-glutamate--2,6-diaminopimelate ligase